jgi:hypothetical protein
MTFPSPTILHTHTPVSFRTRLALVMILGLGSWQGAAHAADPVMRIKSLTQGDTACYITLENARGKRSEEMASFELCEKTQLIGQRVRLKRERSAVMAASCQGDPECKKTQTVNLIVKAEKVR